MPPPPLNTAPRAHPHGVGRFKEMPVSACPGFKSPGLMLPTIGLRLDGISKPEGEKYFTGANMYLRILCSQLLGSIPIQRDTATQYHTSLQPTNRTRHSQATDNV